MSIFSEEFFFFLHKNSFKQRKRPVVPHLGAEPKDPSHQMFPDENKVKNKVPNQSKTNLFSSTPKDGLL